MNGAFRSTPRFSATRSLVGSRPWVRNTKGLELGQRVGVGWNSGSCMHCHQCMSGTHNLCPEVEMTIVGHRGGFASHIRTHWAWAFPLPEKFNFAEAGPLLCGGVTVLA